MNKPHFPGFVLVGDTYLPLLGPQKETPFTKRAPNMYQWIKVTGRYVTIKTFFGKYINCTLGDSV